jgi:hypothetical protein
MEDLLAPFSAGQPADRWRVDLCHTHNSLLFNVDYTSSLV